MIISIINGSQNRKNSLSTRVARHLEKLINTSLPDHITHFIDVRQYDIPLDTAFYDNQEHTPEHLQEMAVWFMESDAFVLVTPEYNGSFSPALKNLLNHFPKFSHKVCCVATASDGALGGMRAAQQLLLNVPAHFGIASPYLLIVPKVQEKFDVHGNLIDASFQRAIDTFYNEFLWLVKKLSVDK